MEMTPQGIPGEHDDGAALDEIGELHKMSAVVSGSSTAARRSGKGWLARTL
jgi:hypothetical protein